MLPLVNSLSNALRSLSLLFTLACETTNSTETARSASHAREETTAIQFGKAVKSRIEKAKSSNKAPSPLVHPGTKTQAPSLSNEECSHLRQIIRETLKAAERCEEDAECERIGVGCPFGCRRFASTKADFESNIKPLIEHERAGCGDCRYKCKSPSPGRPGCVRGRCRWIPTPNATSRDPIPG